ncbi:CAP-Gly domain-containing linker protein 1 [Elysia marginata]|uniref:CAP-Gly domain-containing linker protein 1 n=1 Tax=Elysia marginata TaxID=1093978 RepID=A0AAV4HXL2_9GAST|nr:CAP-Gly domain-containing linker protein 1 [Elysia marginata]
MSLPRPSGIKPPSSSSANQSRIGRPSGLPTPRSHTPVGGVSANPGVTPSRALSALAKSARGVGLAPQSADRYAQKAIPTVGTGPQPPSEDGSASSQGALPPPGPVDDFKIGDRIWVSGTKPGVIAFLGDTQFAPGEWAGVVLDEPIGKNDGSVMGVRYFQCEAKRGVFSRVSKLSHTCQAPSRPVSQASSETPSFPTPARTPSTGGGGGGGGGGETRLSLTPATNGTSSKAPSSSIPARPPSRLGMGASKNLSTSSSSLHKAAPAPGTGVTAMKLPGTMPGGVKVGDRVLVSGSKPGVLRYIGETDFAKGIWAGVELDEPYGKNDGAVAGKRYFECKPMHGLFAPVHKISRAGGSATSTPSPHSRPLMSTSLRASRERSGSQESVSSLSSTASSVSRSRASKTGQRPSTLNLTATTAALQKALKEKEEHIEQLLRERDLERSEVARAAAHVDEAEGKMSSMKTEQDRLRMDAEEQISKYREAISDLENEKTELMAFLEEEKRKVEDLQFQLEEEALKDESDGKGSAASELQMKELERQAKKEKERADALEQEMMELKTKVASQQKTISEADSSQTVYLDQIEDLTYKLTQAEAKVKEHETSRLEDGAKTSQVSIELADKTSRVRELEDELAQQKRELAGMSQELSDLRDELNSSNNKRTKQEDQIQELTNKLKEVEDEHRSMLEELRNANSCTSDLQRQLSASKTKADELATDRAQLEEQISELMRNSGDSSSQLAALNAQLSEKNRGVGADLGEKMGQVSGKLTSTKLGNIPSISLPRSNIYIALSYQHEKNQIEKRLKRAEEEKSAASQELIAARVEVAGLKEQAEKAQGGNTELQDKLEKLTLELEYATKLKEEKEVLALKVDTQKKDIRLEELQKELEKFQADAFKQKEELMLKSQTEAEMLTQELASLRTSLKESQEEVESKEFQMAELQAQLEHSKVLEKERDMLVKEKAEVLEEKESLESKCRDFMKEVEKQSQKADGLDSELRTVRASEGALKRENSSLEDRVAQLEADLVRARSQAADAESKAAAVADNMSGDVAYQQLKEEVTSAHSQVEFLNSVIVELQKKNSDLELRLSAMEDSGIHTNGDFGSAGDHIDMENLPPTHSRAPPRLFCDICDMFDLHDTEDCPKQAMSSSPEPTRYHGDARQARAYCEICEVFGHWTTDCDDEQTF